ncbi:MAG TPA: VOC family protein [Candidatus Binatia bacterium]|nr:VOC family protein [Candidatus Binatia bacterium]
MSDAPIHIHGLDHFVLRVRDLERALGFYRDLLGLHIQFLDDYRKGTRPFVSACIGEQLLDLVPDPTYDPTAGLSAGGFVHLCVRVARPSMAELIPLLKAHGVELIEEQPVPRMGATGMGLSIYVRDPDGYVVELKEQNVGRVER